VCELLTHLDATSLAVMTAVHSLGAGPDLQRLRLTEPWHLLPGCIPLVTTMYISTGCVNTTQSSLMIKYKFEQWLKCNRTQGNAAHLSPMYGSQRSHTSYCLQCYMERHRTTDRGGGQKLKLSVQFPHTSNFALWPP